MRGTFYIISAMVGLGAIVLLTILNWELSDTEIIHEYPYTIQLAMGYMCFGLGGFIERFFQQPKKK